MIKRLVFTMPVALALVFAALVAVAPVSSAPASQLPNDAAACYSLDVVFLIDQSGSMGGAVLGEGNDPNGLRKYAVDWVISWLGDNVLATCPNAVHRIAVVSWGSTVRRDLPLTVIAPAAGQFAAWFKLRDSLTSQIRLDDLKQTDPKLAFAEAKRIFDDAAPLGDLPRKRVIIFVTDGEPCVGSLGCNPPNTTMDFAAYTRQMAEQARNDFNFDETLLRQEECLSDARKQAAPNDISDEVKNQCLKDYSIDPSGFNKSYYIWSILLNKGPDYPAAVRQYIDQISTDHAGQTIPLTQNADIPQKFLEIMSQLAGVKAAQLQCGTFPMESYLERATLGFFKVDPDITVNISYEKDGQVFTITQQDIANKSLPANIAGFTVLDYTQDSTIERYVFKRPYGGQWKIDASDCTGIRGYFEPIDISSELLEPPPTVPQFDLPPYYDEGAPVYIKYRLVDRGGGGESLAEDSRYPITPRVTLTSPDGTVETFDLVYDPTLQAFRSPQPLKVNQVDTYTFTVEATTTYVDRDKTGPRLLFKDGPKTFEVTTVTPFKFSIKEPIANAMLPLHGGPNTRLAVQPISFRVALTGRNGEPLDPALLLVNPNAPLQGTVSSGSAPETVTLSPDPAHPGEFIGQATTLDKEGIYRFSTAFTGAYSPKYRPDNRSAEVTFSRQDTLWTRPLTYQVMTGSALLAILLAVTAFLLQRNNPVTGSLIFELGSQSIAEVPLGSGWNVTKVSRAMLRANPGLSLKSLRARKSSEQAGGVHFEAVDDNNNSYSNDLIPDVPADFTGGMTVRYEPLDRS